MDLRHYFPSIPAGRVHALFTSLGYPSPVARLLTGLCTHRIPRTIFETGPAIADFPDKWHVWPKYQLPHLPQGAPTSPALANLCTYRLDCRLAGLAQALDLHYTRYADDLAFSGGPILERTFKRFYVTVCQIALEEGLEIHTRKTRLMGQHLRQQLSGIVLNSHPNLPRREYDRIKAILYNCVKHGPQSQCPSECADFRAYLTGRIAYMRMINPNRAQKLQDLLNQIHWHELE